MNIIIVGDGKVGLATAAHLSKEGHNVTIIDKDEEALRKADETLDVMCVYGNGARAVILQEAGIESADIVIAVTSKDEINMVCCITAKRLGNVRTIARIRDPEYYEDVDILRNELGIDMVINPEFSAAAEIANILQFPAAMNVESFFSGKVRMVDFRVTEDDMLIGATIAKISQKLPKNVLFAAVEREGEAIIPNGQFEFAAGDKIYVIGQISGITKLFKAVGRFVNSTRSVMIVGGGRTGHYLARFTSNNGIDTKLIEVQHNKCVRLTEQLEDVLIIEGDGTDPKVLESENLEGQTAFVALTGRDEENLITSMYAVEKGVNKVVASISRLHVPQIINKLGIDSIISPQELTATNILGYVRGVGNSRGSIVEALYKIMDGKAEAISFVANDSTSFLNTPLKNIALKKEVIIACILHGKSVIIPHGNEVITKGDKVLILTKSEKVLKDINDILEG